MSDQRSSAAIASECGWQPPTHTTTQPPAATVETRGSGVEMIDNLSPEALANWQDEGNCNAGRPQCSAATGYDEPQGYAASLRQMAKWVREAVDPRTADSQRITLDDIDAEELDAAAAFIDRMTALPQSSSVPQEEDCGCIGAVIGQHERSCPLSRPQR